MGGSGDVPRRLGLCRLLGSPRQWADRGRGRLLGCERLSGEKSELGYWCLKTPLWAFSFFFSLKILYYPSNTQ